MKGIEVISKNELGSMDGPVVGAFAFHQYILC